MTALPIKDADTDGASEKPQLGEQPSVSKSIPPVRLDGHTMEEREAYIQEHLKHCNRTPGLRKKISPGVKNSGQYRSVAHSRRMCAVKAWIRHIEREELSYE